MTTKIKTKGGNIVLIHKEAPKKCDRCSKVRETRDVLGNGSAICFECTSDAEFNIYGARLFNG